MRQIATHLSFVPHVVVCIDPVARSQCEPSSLMQLFSALLSIPRDAKGFRRSSSGDLRAIRGAVAELQAVKGVKDGAVCFHCHCIDAHVQVDIQCGQTELTLKLYSIGIDRIPPRPQQRMLQLTPACWTSFSPPRLSTGAAWSALRLLPLPLEVVSSTSLCVSFLPHALPPLTTSHLTLTSGLSCAQCPRAPHGERCITRLFGTRRFRDCLCGLWCHNALCAVKWGSHVVAIRVTASGDSFGRRQRAFQVEGSSRSELKANTVAAFDGGGHSSQLTTITR